MLSVVYGPFQPDLEKAFLSRLGGLAGRGPLAVVAPSRRLADRLERLAAVEGGRSLLDVHFHTFFSLAAAVVEEEGFERELVRDPVFHDRLVDGLLEGRPRLASVFGGTARPRALASVLRASLRDLLDAGVDAGALEEYFGEELLADPEERKRLAALLELARAYEERLEELGIAAPSALVRAAARRAPGSPALSRFSEILYYGFYDLTGLQLDFFETVVAHHPATLFFPYRRGHPAFRFAEPFFEEKLLAHDPRPAEPAGPAPALGAVLDVLFSPSSRPSPAADALRLVNASGARDEAWAVAKEIAALVESGFCRYEDVGVVARALEPYQAAIEEAFADDAIPYVSSAGEPLLRQPAARAVWSLLSWRRRDYAALQLQDLLASPYFRGADRSWRELISRLEIHGGWLQWRGKLEKPAEDEAAGRRGLWELVLSLERELSAEEASWSALAARAERLVEGRLAPPSDASSREAAAWQAALEAVRSLAAFDRLGEAPSWDAFLDCLEEKLQRAALPAPTEGRGVRVLGAMDARGESFEVVFLLGLKEKLFPRLIQEDPLLREPARAALRHPAGYWISRKSAGYEEERLLFYLVAASARRRLYAVYPRSDESGKAEVPSLYLRELCRAAGADLSDPAANRRVPREPAGRLASAPPDLLSPAEASLARTLFGEGPASLSGALARAREMSSWGAPGRYDGLIGEPREFLADWKARGVSPTALDALAECPFRFLAAQVLGLVPEEEAAEKGDFTAKTRGRIYHGVLERFFRDAPEETWKNGASWRPRLQEAIEATFSDHDWRSLGVYPLLWLAAKRAMSDRLARFVAWDLGEGRASGLRPIWLEKEVGGEVGGVKVRGRIDRVDVDPEKRRFRVVDYKTRGGAQAKIAGLIQKGKRHQLPLYSELAAQALGAELESARLLFIEDSPETTGAPRAHVYEEKEWAADRPAFLAGLSALVERVARGRFPIRPDDGEYGYCARCQAAAMCRRGHGPSRYRAAQVS